MAEFLGLSVYLWIMIIFLAALVVVFLFGDIGGVDGGNGGDVAGLSPISLPIVTVFGTSFGGMGTILEAANFNAVTVALGASVFGFLVAAGLYVLVFRVFVQTQADTKVVLAALVGSSAQVTIPVGPGQTGQILIITEARGRTLIPAVSNDRIGTDELVVILEIVGNAARVERKGV